MTPELSIESIPLPDRAGLIDKDELFRWAIAEAKNLTSRNVKLKTIIVNALRHKNSDYETELARVPRGKGARTWVLLGLLRGRIYAEISRDYPFLAAECERQARRRRCTKQYRQALDSGHSVQ